MLDGNPAQRPPELPARLDEFRQLRDGWLEGAGLAPVHSGLDWLAAEFARRFPVDCWPPHAYPTEKGGVRLEWSYRNHAMILEIDLTARRGDWLWFDRDSDAEHEKALNLENAAAWGWLAQEIIQRTNQAE